MPPILISFQVALQRPFQKYFIAGEIGFPPDGISIWGLLLSDFPRVLYNPTAGELYSSPEAQGSGLWVVIKVFCIYAS